MSKTLKQIQEENREFIIIANNPTAKTYDEALGMELRKIKTCQHSSALWDNSHEQLYLEDYKDVYYIDYDHVSNDPWSYAEYVGKFEDIIKLTLNKVLISIRKHFEFFKNYNELLNNNHILEFENPNKDSEILLSWDLKKETLEEQSEETQREINELYQESKKYGHKVDIEL